MKSVFLVDDSATVRQHAKQALEQIGFSVHLAKDGQEANERLPEFDIDLLITDYNMPFLNGIELTQKVRQMDNKRFMPILMLTTEVDEKLIQMGKKYGISTWLNKATDMDRLPKLVRLLVGH